MSRTSPLVWLPLALALAGSQALAGEVQGLRLTAADGSTRVEVDLAGAGPYRVFTLQHPDRLVLDLDQSKIASGLRLPGANGLVANVRSGQPKPGTLRLVFDLGGPVVASDRLEAAGARSRLLLELRDPAAPVAAKPAASALDTLAMNALATPVPPAAVTIEPAPPATPTPVPASAPVAPVVESAVPAGARTAAPAKTLQDVIGNGRRELVVAVDAGHGGKDPGAHGPSGVQEKRVTLAVARELARQIDADPGMKAVLIRDDDTFVPLEGRFQKARAAQADLFISIHADAAPSQAASGASVFVLSTRGASSQAARWLADKENAADLVGGVSLDDKDRNLSAVLLDLSQSATMRASDDVASQVLAALKQVGKAHKPAIERANFVVLRSPDVPSMLVETGFITNPGEEKKLNDADYRRRLASAITSGVRAYFSDQPPPGTYYAAQLDNDDAPRQHLVMRGETLSLIAAQHGVPVDSIRVANGMHGDRVRVGERLLIPAAAMVASAPK